jgi:hypothetical protein
MAAGTGRWGWDGAEDMAAYSTGRGRCDGTVGRAACSRGNRGRGKYVNVHRLLSVITSRTFLSVVARRDRRTATEALTESLISETLNPTRLPGWLDSPLGDLRQ